MRRITALVALLAVAVLAASSGFAAYPERPIKMIVPWAAGGDTDVIKRVWAEAAKKHLPQPIVVANITVFVLGFFIDFFEIAFIILPMLVPAARRLGIDLVWFGVLLGMNLQTSFLTPPFGFALFYLRGVTPEHIPTTTIYKGVVPFIAIQMIALLLVCLFPGLVTR